MEFMCSRPRLAGRLYHAGAKLNRVTNPFDPERDAWIVTLDDYTAAMIAEYYMESDKPLPKAIRKYMEGSK